MTVQVSAAAALLYPLLYFFDQGGWFAALLPAAAAHEAGHWAALGCCGARVTCLRLDAAGLCMETTPLHSRRDALLCAAAGPAAGLLWAGFCLLFKDVYLRRSGEASLLLTAFNLLPVLPLDGGRLLLAATGSQGLLRFCGVATALLCAVAGAAGGAHGLFIPAGLCLWSALRS